MGGVEGEEEEDGKGGGGERNRGVVGKGGPSGGKGWRWLGRGSGGRAVGKGEKGGRGEKGKGKGIGGTRKAREYCKRLRKGNGREGHEKRRERKET